MSTTKQPEILIAGGGIGGVSLALALSIRGLRSHVFEKAPEFGEIGYGIQLGPNAHRMLAWLGVIDEIEQQAVHTENMILIDALTDREVARIITGPKFSARYGAPYIVVHRRDLHGALLEACRRRGEEIGLHVSKELVDFTERGNRVVAKFADGSEYEGAALIGADGLRSRVREIVIGAEPPRPAGHVTYRGVVPVDEVKDKSHFNDMVIWIGSNLHLVQYRLRGGTVMNNVVTVASQKFLRGQTSDYGGPEEVQEIFAATTPSVKQMLSYVGMDKNWVLHDREPTLGWTRGRATLLGDAAHPTLQYLAQGANMAIEDAVVLAAKLSKANGNTNAALLAYENDRFYRPARVTLTSRLFGQIMHSSGGARELRNHICARRDPDFPLEVDWLYRGIEVEP